MIEQQATVIEIHDKSVVVEAERHSTCSKCSIKKGCGTGLLAKHVGRRFAKLEVKKTIDVIHGDEVRLAISEEALLSGAFTLYIIPLLLMFVFAAIASYLQQLFYFHEFIEIIAGICGLLIGFVWVHQRMNSQKDKLQIRIIEE